MRRILVSAHSDFDDLVTAINTGSLHAFIYKPWDVDHLRLSLRVAVDAYLNDELSSTFSMPIAPVVGSVDGIAELTARRPSSLKVVPHPIIERLTEEMKSYREELGENKERIRYLENIADKYTAELDERRNSGQNNTHPTRPITAMMAQSIEPNLISIINNITIVCAILSRDLPSIYFWSVFANKWGKKFYNTLIAIERGLRSFKSTEPISEQPEVLEAFRHLRLIVVESQDEKHVSNRRIKEMLGAFPAMVSISKNYEVIAASLMLGG